jgi:predicted nucleic acid-binding protein
MKTPIIVDSSGLISLVSEDDMNHKIAIKISEELVELSALLIVSSDVFSETLNVIGKKFGHDLAMKVGQELSKSEAYTIIETDEALRDSAMVLLDTQAQSVSFTDCVVMACADKFNSKHIFGFDKVFKKNGYTRLGFDKMKKA